MPATFLYPAADGTQDEWVLSDSSKWAAMASNDGDTSYIFAADAAVKSQGFTHDGLDTSAIEITTHVLRTTAKRPGAGGTHRHSFLWLSAVFSYGSCVDPGVAYSNRDDTDLAKPGGGSVGPDDVNNIEIGIQTCNTGDAAYVRCTRMYWLVTWVPGGGGVAKFLVDWIPPLIASGLFGNYLKMETPSVYRAMAKIFSDLKIKNIPAWQHPDEIELLFNELTCRPVFSFLGG